MAPLKVVLEPLVVASLLGLGTLANRRRTGAHLSLPRVQVDEYGVEEADPTSEADGAIRLASPSRTSSPDITGDKPRWRMRRIGILRWTTYVVTPDTRRYRGSIMSRLIGRYPFLIEAWYWFLIYWVYQIARAVTAVLVDQEVVHVARVHAFQIIAIEQRLRLFHEPQVQRIFLQHPAIVEMINATYSYVHIPATILFLILLYYVAITLPHLTASLPSLNHRPGSRRALSGSQLYCSRRRTLAMSNLIAFFIFTFWPLMPPRLLSDKSVTGPTGDKARGFGFVDTVHRSGTAGGSIWTTNKFCNQWAAMPSLHFGYALLIGLTVMTLPLSPAEPTQSKLKLWSTVERQPLINWRRMFCLAVGIFYPTLIFAAVVATANHFFLDIVGGAVVVSLAWFAEPFLLNLLPLEDWFLSLVRIHKPEMSVDSVLILSKTRQSSILGA
ncbi:MAG: hypothetical protein M1817_004595 [Caeruleum heppii]|nr:MAG: hypothetical protein M1817_004595 [Caeruleum heppii]